MKKSEFENESDDPLWDLLGKAKPVEVSPFFSRNVLREIRKKSEADQKSQLFSWSKLRLLRLVLIGATSLAIVLLSTQVSTKDRTGITAYAIRPGDKEVISNLDELLASDDSSVWLDNSGYSE